MMAALDKTPKLVKKPTPRSEESLHDFITFHNSYILNDEQLSTVPGLTCHSTPSKKQHGKSERYGRSRINSLPCNDQVKKRSSSYSYSYNRQNSLESDLELGSSNQSVLEEKRLEFERRRRQVWYFHFIHWVPFMFP